MSTVKTQQNQQVFLAITQDQPRYLDKNSILLCPEVLDFDGEDLTGDLISKLGGMTMFRTKTLPNLKHRTSTTSTTLYLSQPEL